MSHKIIFDKLNKKTEEKMKKILLTTIVIVPIIAVLAVGTQMKASNSDANTNKNLNLNNIFINKDKDADNSVNKNINSNLNTNEKKELVGIDPGHQLKGNSELEPVAPGSNTKKAKVSSGTQGVATKKNEYQLTLEVGLKLRDALKSKG